LLSANGHLETSLGNSECVAAFRHHCDPWANFHSGGLPMAKDRERLTVELAPDVRQQIEQWAASEGRPISNLLRRVLSEIVDQRVAARGAAARRRLPSQKQLTA